MLEKVTTWDFGIQHSALRGRRVVQYKSFGVRLLGRLGLATKVRESG